MSIMYTIADVVRARRDLRNAGHKLRGYLVDLGVFAAKHRSDKFRDVVSQQRGEIRTRVAGLERGISALSAILARECEDRFGTYRTLLLVDGEAIVWRIAQGTTLNSPALTDLIPMDGEEELQTTTDEDFERLRELSSEALGWLSAAQLQATMSAGIAEAPALSKS